MSDANRPDENRPEDESAAAAGAPESGAPAAGGPDSDAAAPAEFVDAADAAGIEEDELTVQDILDAADLEASDPSSEHLADLKRVTAEYANYRKRTEANREIERERVTGEVVKVLLPVLDDLYRAEKHGDLEGDTAFATIAAKLRASTERIGLKPYGTVGDVFDPTVHEAIFQMPTPDIDVETVGDVVETGYYLGSSLLRVAKVVVQVPSDG
ncbi:MULTISPECIES: nucleotide exchange factor GrpE [Cryobacterium]|uniref:Protein GrpE n=1 Tax=Cryobacterium zongtaii TaxID=1259217 RepID=A0A2S3ZG30_9MICO|nr:MULTISPECIES: nucleotide exchange factor GrpE [Cryobacterium]MEC5185437.1 molecular chaperone GrpE [Cryobacterium sp. MP_3.1]POH63564.1 nucleotide exchange factor GrpE [Cryobacterium zongtaii]POH66341.1 nucleotide exchange factor GrpE [Cryobacterium zongtaii]POH66681.1 nucleotide exchange factor GrpE [Cryobacterium zongtaii]TFC42097.1 nucleotide exchange factor GrpE [Cryobacterium sp. TMN-39-2]